MMKHHLVPKAKGGRETLDCCRDCHKAIHLHFTNAALARHYHTVERLLEVERYSKMVAYIAKQNPFRKVTMRRPKKRDRVQ